jgi:putative transcriptional regulator
MPSESRRYRGIVRKILPVAGVMALLMSFDGVRTFLTQADPRLKALLGAGLFFFVWLLILWDDLREPKQQRPVAGANDNRPMVNSLWSVDTLLKAFAAGTLSEPFAVLAASHLQIMADNAAFASPTPDHERLTAIVAIADPAADRRPRQPMSAVDQMNVFLPPALRSYVGRHLGALKWRAILPGIKQCRIACDADGDASFLRCRPGSVIPAHTHAGLEAVLVLHGSFRDAHGRYVRGDIAVADATIDHRPVADAAAECIIFIVEEAPVRLTGPFGRLVQRLFGR